MFWFTFGFVLKCYLQDWIFASDSDNGKAKENKYKSALRDFKTNEFNLQHKHGHSICSNKKHKWSKNKCITGFISLASFFYCFFILNVLMSWVHHYFYNCTDTQQNEILL